ncbi:nuclear pore complex protein Nup205 [Diorhabda carinulata]|uniref:nuclear pore complex protein Nup205 n=1 Tax=Diorhabda carinulata TaxID=1163345 RepID=UPI0025A08E72|nr:nuclear pore complex protein Nup205 [Diorhabda carinulata]
MDDVPLQNKTEDLWNPYKELKSNVWKYLNQSSEELNTAEFENVLRRNKQSFFSLLQNPPKNISAREELKKGMVDGINVRGIGHQIISNELYQETIILSDMFSINELVALDLLCTAQMQMPYYPGLPRGLVAVLLYYDGRKALVTTLLYLVQARNGVQWSVSCKPDIAAYITSYTDQLMEGGLFNRIFELLRTLDLSKEIDHLQANLALGGPKHRRQVIDMFNDIRHILSDIVFTWAAQCGLPKNATVALINYLRETKLEEESSGKIDDVNLYLQMAFLSALDVSILHTREDGEKAVQSLPIFEDTTYIPTIVNEFSMNKSKWMCEGLQALSTFGLAVCISSLRDIPQSFRFQDAINREESFADTAIEMNVFTFLHNIFLENNTIYKEPFLYKRIHNLMTDFIFSMYPKIKDLRMKADEIARTMQVYIREGLEVPANLPRYFEYLLLSVGKIYKNDVLNTDYVSDYWSPIEINPNQISASRAAPRSVALFKFIRLAGDVLPTTLFVPYLTMLSGLSSSQQTARHCFNMLKQAGLHISGNLSWDHFFVSFSQYYNNLRQEAPPQTDTIYMTRAPYHKGVSPQELEGLHAVLLLIRTVAEHDEFSRLALCEHPGWSPLSTLLGLVSCSIPIPLKADLLLTLAALSKSSENASQMWENLEASQILVTIPTTSSYAPRGIQTELEEIESRLEEYPLTRAMLKLLDELTNFGIPRMLGAGPRKPGFDPYLSFIINSVFLKHHTRSYRNPSEKWEVAYLCLKLIEKFLNQYDPKTNDFLVSNLQSEPSAPGYHLMLQLNSKSELFYVLMNLIDEGNSFFETFVQFHSQEPVKNSILSSLNIIYRVLILQNKFFRLLTSSSTPIVLTSMNKLLMSINRRTGKPDHCVNIAKFVTYQVHMPDHSYVAVRIITHITSSCVIHNHFMNILLSMEESTELIKNGFVECLDNNSDENTETIEKTKKEIVKLLKQALPYNAPNMSHLLLGFDIKKEISKTEFQFPGVLGFPRSSFHSVISIMDAAVHNSFEKPSPTLLESVYHLLYLLASDSKTSSPVLRFIRQNKMFYQEQLIESCSTIGEDLAEYGQVTWLLKTLAIELKVLSQLKQVTHLRQLTHFLINLPSEEKNKGMFAMIEQTTIDTKMMLPEALKMDNFLTSLIPLFEINLSALETPNWEYFDSNVLSQILQNCQQKHPPKMIDLKKLHQVLYDELKTLQGTAVMGQIQAITQEIQKVLKYALETNKRNETFTVITRFTDAWRQVAEVLVLFTPIEILSSTEQQVVSISLLKHLLKDISKAQLLPEVSRLLSGAVLLLTHNLRKCHLREKKLEEISSVNTEVLVDVLKLYYTSLKEILENLIQWIIVSDVINGELRVNLYASLVSFLQLTDKDAPHEDVMFNNSLFVTRLDSSKLSITEEKMPLEFSTEVLSSFGDKLIEIICQDCIGGQEICKILAMSGFTHLMLISGNINWMLHLSSRGYLKHIIQSIEDSNNELRNILEPQAESIKPLYLYSAKMLLLARVAGTKMGSELLLEQKLLTVFSNMSVFSFHPEISKIWQADDILEDFLPPLEQKYLQLWLPTLHICNAILTTLGTENQSAVAQIMFFLLSHLDVVELILRSGCPDLSPMSLKELSLLTSIFARTANNNLINILENPNIVQNNRAQLYRIQKLMLSLLPKFILSEDNVKKLTSHSSHETVTFQTSDRLLYAMQIISNLLCYSRNIVANNGIEHTGIGVLFYPTLSDPLLNNIRNVPNNNEQEPSLGIVVQELISVVNFHHQEKVTHDLLVRKLREIPDMNSAELRPYINESIELSDLSSKREKAYEVISDKLEKKKKEINYCAFIIENSLYIIWTHLDFYMLKAIPRTRNFMQFPMNPLLKPDTTLASSSEATWKVSTDLISSLKQGLVSLFNDSFTKRLLETAQDRNDSDRGFVETLLRKIKRLVQFVPVK